jgi:hypothetical protein
MTKWQCAISYSNYYSIGGQLLFIIAYKLPYRLFISFR